MMKIVKTCQQNDVHLILTCIPNLDSWTDDKYRIIKQLSSQYNLRYLDMNLDNLADINWVTDTRDGGIHLNNNGAYKTTSCIGEQLLELK